MNPVPRYTADHNDIVTCFDSGSAAALQGFCAGIQSCSPVDSFVSPEPADEPGYTDQVIMASGSFTEALPLKSAVTARCAPLHLLFAGRRKLYRRPRRRAERCAEGFLCLIAAQQG